MESCEENHKLYIEKKKVAEGIRKIIVHIIKVGIRGYHLQVADAEKF